MTAGSGFTPVTALSLSDLKQQLQILEVTSVTGSNMAGEIFISEVRSIDHSPSHTPRREAKSSKVLLGTWKTDLIHLRRSLESVFAIDPLFLD